MKTFRYILHARVLDHARLGWMIADTLDGTPHGQYAVLMVWLCGCKELTAR